MCESTLVLEAGTTLQRKICKMSDEISRSTNSTTSESVSSEDESSHYEFTSKYSNESSCSLQAQKEEDDIFQTPYHHSRSFPYDKYNVLTPSYTSSILADTVSLTKDRLNPNFVNPSRRSRTVSLDRREYLTEEEYSYSSSHLSSDEDGYYFNTHLPLPKTGVTKNFNSNIWSDQSGSESRSTIQQSTLGLVDFTNMPSIMSKSLLSASQSLSKSHSTTSLASISTDDKSKKIEVLNDRVSNITTSVDISPIPPIKLNHHKIGSYSRNGSIERTACQFQSQQLRKEIGSEVENSENLFLSSLSFAYSDDDDEQTLGSDKIMYESAICIDNFVSEKDMIQCAAMRLPSESGNKNHNRIRKDCRSRSFGQTYPKDTEYANFNDYAIHSSNMEEGLSHTKSSLPEHEKIIASSNGTIEPYKIYWQRWLMLFYLSILNLLSDWTCYSVAPISVLTSEAFGTINPELLVTIFLAANTLGTCFEPIFLARIGLRKTIIVGSFLLMLGSMIKSGGIPWIMSRSLEKGYGEWRVYFGFFVVGLSQPLYQCTPALLSSSWFPEKERTLATAMALNSNQLGIGCAFVFGTIFVATSDDIPIYFGLLTFLSILAFIGCCVHFEDAPPTPPSETARVMRGTLEVQIPSMENIRDKVSTHWNDIQVREHRSKTSKVCESNWKNSFRGCESSEVSYQNSNDWGINKVNRKRENLVEGIRRESLSLSHAKKGEPASNHTSYSPFGSTSATFEDGLRSFQDTVPSSAFGTESTIDICSHNLRLELEAGELCDTLSSSPMMQDIVKKCSSLDSNEYNDDIHQEHSTNTSKQGSHQQIQPAAYSEEMNDFRQAYSARLSDCQSKEMLHRDKFEASYQQSDIVDPRIYYQAWRGMNASRYHYNQQQKIMATRKAHFASQIHILSNAIDEGAEPVLTQKGSNLDIDIRDDQIIRSIRACFARPGFIHSIVAFSASGIVVNTLSTYMDYLVRIGGSGRQMVGIVGGLFQLIIMISSMILGQVTDKTRRYHAVIISLLVLGAFALAECGVSLDASRGDNLIFSLGLVAIMVGPLQPIATELGVEM